MAFKAQKEVHPLHRRDQTCSVIGKFTQDSKEEGEMFTHRFITDQCVLDYLVYHTRQSDSLVGAPEMCHLDLAVTNYDESQCQYIYLGTSTLRWRFSQEEPG